MQDQDQTQQANKAHKADLRQVQQALAGNLPALENLLQQVKDDVFKLALKFLWHVQDAEDASQEILVRIITGLHTYRGHSTLRTWAYRVAVNYLLNLKRNRIERSRISFAGIETQLESQNQVPEFVNQVEQEQLARHVRSACTHAMLQALERDARMAFLLGSIFQMQSKDAAYILGIKAETYRKRLSRARQAMHNFLHKNCGVRNPDASCRCENRIAYAQKKGEIDAYARLAEELQASGSLHKIEQNYNQDYKRIGRMAMIFQHPTADQMSTRVLQRVQKLLQQNGLAMLDPADSHPYN